MVGTQTLAESAPIPVTGYKLNGNNYLQWLHSVKKYVSGEGKDEYLTGEIVPPNPGYPNYKLWKTKNNMIMLWLVNSMTNAIGDNFLLYSMTYEI